MAEGLVRLDRVHAFVLEIVGMQLVEEPDSAALLVADVEDHPDAVHGNGLHRRVELRAAVATQASEDVSGQTLRVGSKQHRAF